jgi:hypothetical protein
MPAISQKFISRLKAKTPEHSYQVEIRIRQIDLRNVAFGSSLPRDLVHLFIKSVQILHQMRSPEEQSIEGYDKTLIFSSADTDLKSIYAYSF